LAVAHPERNFQSAVVLCVLFGADCILASQHLHKSMALVLVDDASLNSAITGENGLELWLGASVIWVSEFNGSTWTRIVTLTLHRPRTAFG
jgi:hypothetical protein